MGAKSITLSTDASIVQQHKIRAKILDRVAHVGRHVKGSLLCPAAVDTWALGGRMSWRRRGNIRWRN